MNKEKQHKKNKNNPKNFEIQKFGAKSEPTRTSESTLNTWSQKSDP